MQDSDFPRLSALLDTVADLRQRKPLADTAKAMYAVLLRKHPIERIERAMYACIASGPHMPQPNELLEWLTGAKGNDGRPGVEEAWATAVRAGDEWETVVWTQEIQQAFFLARPLLAEGDKVGARMAFKEAYERLVAKARTEGVLVSWLVNLGWDQQARTAALESAVTAGRIGRDFADQHLLTGPSNAEFVKLLAGPALATVDGVPVANQKRDHALAQLQRLRQTIMAPVEDQAEAKRAAYCEREESRRAELVAQAQGGAA